MGNPLVPTDFDRFIAPLLDDELRGSSMSLRELSRRSGIKLTRLGDILRRGKAMTVGELNAICRALELVASEVVREAEEAAARQAQDVVEPSTEPDAAPVVPLHLNIVEEDEPAKPDFLRMAAKIMPERAREIEERTGWRDDLGEVDQTNS